MQPNKQKAMSVVIGVLGLALLVFMVTVEGEPGALPLALLLIAAIGYVAGVARDRSARGRSASKA